MKMRLNSLRSRLCLYSLSVESTIDELKVHLLGRKTLIRSLNPREVVPRVVKKTRAKFPSKKPIHRGQGAKLETLTFSILNTA